MKAKSAHFLILSFASILSLGACLSAISAGNSNESLDERSGIQALKEAAILAQTLSEKTKPPPTTTRQASDVKIFDQSNLLSKLLWLPYGRELNREFEEILKRVAHPEDLKRPSSDQRPLLFNEAPETIVKFKYKKTMSIAPWSSLLTNGVWQKSYDDRGILFLGLGLFAVLQSEDELAALIAAQLASENQDLNNLPLTRIESPWIKTYRNWINDELIKLSIDDPDDLHFRKTVLSDIQAIERIIEGGYNPNALVDIHMRVANWAQSKKELKIHHRFLTYFLGRSYLDITEKPIQELRISIMKKYIFFRIHSENLSDLITQKKGLSPSMSALKDRAMILSTLLTHPWTKNIAVLAVLSSSAYMMTRVKGAGIIFNPLFVWFDKYMAPLIDSIFTFRNFKMLIVGVVGLGISVVILSIYQNRSIWFNMMKNILQSIWGTVRRVSISSVNTTLAAPKYAQNLYQKGLGLVKGLIGKAPLFLPWLKTKIKKTYYVTKDITYFLIDYAIRCIKALFHFSKLLTLSLLKFGYQILNDLIQIASGKWTGKESTLANYVDTPNVNNILSDLISRIRSAFEKIESVKKDNPWPLSFLRKHAEISKLMAAHNELINHARSISSDTKKIILGAYSLILASQIPLLLENPKLLPTVETLLRTLGAVTQASFDDPAFPSKFSESLYFLERMAASDYAPSVWSALDTQTEKSRSSSEFSRASLERILRAEENAAPLSQFIFLIAHFNTLTTKEKFKIVNTLAWNIVRQESGFMATRFAPIIVKLFKSLSTELGENLFFNSSQDQMTFERQITELESLIEESRHEKIPSKVRKLMLSQLLLSQNQLNFKTFLSLYEAIQELSVIKLVEKPRPEIFDLLYFKRQRIASDVEQRILDFANYHELEAYNPMNPHSIMRGLGENTSKFYLIDKFISKMIRKSFSKTNLSDMDRIGWYSVSASIPKIRRKAYRTRARLLKMQRSWFRNLIETRFQSISEIKKWIEQELIPHQINMDGLIADFYQLVFNHPEWIKSKSDIEALTQSPYFWPKRNSLGNQATELESVILKSLESEQKKFSKYWQVEPAAAEALHQRIIDFINTNPIYGSSFDEQFEFWKTLSARGVTSITDGLFERLWSVANDDQKELLAESALEGRIWDLPLKVSLVRHSLKSSPAFLRLKYNPQYRSHSLVREKRLKDIALIIDKVQKSLPERGIGYFSILEDFANEIRSDRNETIIIEKAKYGENLPDNQSQDFAVHTLSDMLQIVLSWKLEEQLEFILFLRGDIEPSPFIQSQFNVVGSGRVRRIFQILPIEARAGVIESFLASPRGLLSENHRKDGYAEILTNHLLKDGSKAAQEVGKQVLEAFLYAMEQTGHQNYKSYVFSYLLSMLKGNQESSAGAVLKRVLEAFGATGVKIGQFLAISGVLPDSENKYLEELQDRAKVPDRMHIYQEMESILGTNSIAFDLENILGSASLKYAVKMTAHQSKESVVFKILRKESEVHVETEFDQLHQMADYLVSRNGARYGIFRAIINASQKAVERELKLQSEAEMSKLAHSRIYNAKPHPKVRIAVPLEFTMASRLMASQFAPGSSFRELDPIYKPLAAEAILRLEVPNLFSDSIQDSQFPMLSDFAFDPDRHAGNYRIQILNKDPSGDLLSLVPIDFGQVLTMNFKDRSLFFDLFAISGILNKTGSTSWAISKIKHWLNIKDSQFEKLLEKHLPRYFNPNSPIENPMSAYYALLAALEDVGHGQTIQFFDFPRAIAQLTRYTEFVQGIDPKLDPASRLKVEVEKRVEILKTDMESNIQETDGLKGTIIHEHLTGQISWKSKAIQNCTRWLHKIRRKG